MGQLHQNLPQQEQDLLLFGTTEHTAKLLYLHQCISRSMS